METRVAVISVIVENEDSANILNTLFHEYREYIIGRMGIPKAVGVLLGELYKLSECEL